jgi:glyoxylase-like metal-dependent hydrolase (beta-lactamase superfamily II)
MTYTNCYIVISDNKKDAIIIDPASNFEEIRDTVLKKGVKVSEIVLTHGHFDHIGAVDLLRREFDAKVSIHEADADFLQNPDLNCSSLMSYNNITVSPADRLLKDGDIISFGENSLTVMNTPGHTQGCIVLLGDSVAFTGDTIFRGSYGRYDLPRGNFSALKDSLKKVLALDPDTVLYPGHGGITTVREEQ